MPVNETNIRPLSAHALAELRKIARESQPTRSVTPSVLNRLLSENFVRPGSEPDRLEITNAGDAVLEAATQRIDPNSTDPDSPEHPTGSAYV
jgi:hypothetical protein